MSSKGHVDLIHGLGRTKYSMNKLVKALRKAGFSANSIGHPSLSKGVKCLALDHVLPQIRSVEIGPAVPRFIVGHSLGCIITRFILKEEQIENFQRCVMLGPPNGGSHILLAHSRVGRYVLGPVIDDLHADETSLVNELGAIDFPTGVIMGTGNTPVSWLLPKGQPHDGTVTFASAKKHLTEDSHFTVVEKANHSFMMNNKDVIAQTLHYLEHGAFKE